MPQKTIIKTYHGKQVDATRYFKTDCIEMAKEGYYPISQSYQPGSWGCGSFLVALLLCFVLIGIIVFIYMMIVKPAGTLTVTYEYKSIGEGVKNEETGEKICPQCAEAVKIAAKICRFCGHDFSTIQEREVTDNLSARELSAQYRKEQEENRKDQEEKEDRAIEKRYQQQRKREE